MYFLLSFTALTPFTSSAACGTAGSWRTHVSRAHSPCACTRGTSGNRRCVGPRSGQHKSSIAMRGWSEQQSSAPFLEKKNKISLKSLFRMKARVDVSVLFSRKRMHELHSCAHLRMARPVTMHAGKCSPHSAHDECQSRTLALQRPPAPGHLCSRLAGSSGQFLTGQGAGAGFDGCGAQIESVE